MAQQGVYFALLPSDLQRLRDAENDEQLLAVVQDDIEERWDEPWLFQTDKGWAGIHVVSQTANSRTTMATILCVRAFLAVNSCIRETISWCRC